MSTYIKQKLTVKNVDHFFEFLPLDFISICFNSYGIFLSVFQISLKETDIKLFCRSLPISIFYLVLLKIITTTDTIVNVFIPLNCVVVIILATVSEGMPLKYALERILIRLQ